ncbi:MAG TPA: hypothetical protein VM915_07370 [Verrucomicrobiae bacterium]|nr:hypothetical protein [Verrucomicrobiae bacterium]
MSERATVQERLIEWINAAGCFTAPYGVLASTRADKGGKTFRSITFGVARVSDVWLKIYSPKFLVINDSRYGQVKCGSVDEALKVLAENYRVMQPTNGG